MMSDNLNSLRAKLGSRRRALNKYMTSSYLIESRMRSEILELQDKIRKLNGDSRKG